MHALTAMLRDMHLSGGVFLDAEFTAPWCILAQVGPEDFRPHMVTPQHLVAYHYILEGTCTVGTEGEPAREVKAGQLIVVPRNDRHTLGSGSGIAPVDAAHLITHDTDDGIGRIRCGGGGPATRILCGFLVSDSACIPLFAGLPATIFLTLDPHRFGAWIEGSLRYAMREVAAGSPAAVVSLTRLSELVLVEALREYVQQLPPPASAWLRGLGDPIAGRAVALIHAGLARPWSVDMLAREVGTSRSVLIERFTRLIGVPPMEYVRRRRLERAADRLAHTDVPIRSIAFEIGYGSEAAFSRRFRRAYGSSPGAFRKAAVGRDGGTPGHGAVQYRK